MRSSSSGYVFLVGILSVSLFVGTLIAALFLFGIGETKSSISINVSAQALANANTCVERAMQTLRRDLTYIGDETFSLPTGSCTIYPIIGYGNEQRSVCTEGTRFNISRRLEVSISKVLPTTLVTSWSEVPTVSLCFPSTSSSSSSSSSASSFSSSFSSSYSSLFSSTTSSDYSSYSSADFSSYSSADFSSSYSSAAISSSDSSFFSSISFSEDPLFP